MTKVLDEIATLDITSVDRDLGTELSPQEVLALKDMFLSDGWRLMREKIWGQILKTMILQALLTKDDQRFYQGLFQGYKQAMDLAQLLDAEDDLLKTLRQIKKDQQDNMTGYDMDTENKWIV